MKTIKLLFLLTAGTLFFGCNSSTEQKDKKVEAPAKDSTFEYLANRFADIQVLRYQIPGFNELPLQKKKLAYYLYQAGLCGRDIFYDQKCKYNLAIRKTIEAILTTYKGKKDTDDYKKFVEYASRFFFSNGIHHHYASTKMLPDFSKDYFKELVNNSDESKLPLNGKKKDEFITALTPVIFDPNIYSKEVDLSPDVDNIKASANNFYDGVTKKEADDFYNSIKKTGKEQPSWGLNSQLTKIDGKVTERPWKVGGMYGPAIEKINSWLEKAAGVAENDAQKKSIELLIEYYKTGDLATFDKQCIAWVADTNSVIDISNGFIEVYQDATQRKGSYESITSMKDMEATKMIEKISRQAQWFEDHSSIADAHKKKNVVGITAKVITVIGEVGDAAPSTPIGINLPNSEWIREKHGSKSVQLSNIVASYNYARAKSPMIDEFGESKTMIDRYKQYGALSSDLLTDMHEVIGHASGQINPGVGTTDQTLKGYAGTLEEARADLVALYYIMDQKLVDIGVMPSLEVGKAQYDFYLLNGMMTQLNRIELGNNIEESHMRDRQMIALWVYENGKKDNVVEKISRDGKTYIKINDYDKLRKLFGDLLKEIQRIKSEGDYEGGKKLVETYGVKVDQALLKEIRDRYKKLNIAPYMGFIQPKLVAVMEGNEIKDVKVEYPKDFIEQMLEYGKDYGYLPVVN